MREKQLTQYRVAAARFVKSGASTQPIRFEGTIPYKLTGAAPWVFV